MAKNLRECAKPKHCHLCTVKKSISTTCRGLIISGFIRVNSAKHCGEKNVGQTDRQKMAKPEASPGLSPAKKGPDTSGCNYNSEFELTFD